MIACSGARFPGRLPINARCSGAGRREASGLMPRSNAGRTGRTSWDFGATTSQGAWSYPHEAADHLLGVYTGAGGRLGRHSFAAGFSSFPARGARGRSVPSAAKTSSRSPRSSTAARTSTGSGRTRRRFSCAAISSSPSRPPTRRRRGRSAGKAKYRSVSRWDHARGRLLIDTPYTQGVAGWLGGDPVSLPHLDFATQNPFAVLVATSISDEPIATSKRLLVSAIARVEPTGFRWVDTLKREVADPGRPPFLQEPVSATVVWRHKGKVRAFVLDNTGARTDEVEARDDPGPRRRVARDRRQDRCLSLGIDRRMIACPRQVLARAHPTGLVSMSCTQSRTGTCATSARDSAR